MSKLDEILEPVFKLGYEHSEQDYIDLKQQLKDWALEQRIDELEHILQTGDRRIYTYKSKRNGLNIPIKERIAELRKQIRGGDGTN